MIGIVIVSHGDLGKSLIQTAEFIVGEQNCIGSVSIEGRDSLEEIKNKIEHAIKETDAGNGVLILTDMLGGSPSIASLSYLNKYKIKVVAGVNLPMLLEVILHREEFDFNRLAALSVKKGKESIILASPKKRKKD